MRSQGDFKTIKISFKICSRLDFIEDYDDFEDLEVAGLSQLIAIVFRTFIFNV